MITKKLILFIYINSLTILLISQSLLFEDVTKSAGLPMQGNSQGIAIVDYDNDGWEDIYISVETGRNRLCRNNGDGTFSEVAAVLGLDFSDKTKTSIWGDINNDGFKDIYVANLRSADQLLLNKGNDVFENITEKAGIQNINNPTSVNLADINNDGFLDIYISNFQTENILYLNNGDETFSNFTNDSGALDTGSSMGSIFVDYDKDGDMDLYLVHDNIEPNILYQNDGLGHFKNVANPTRADVKGYGMGVAVGDVNNDGFPDLYITNLFKNYLLVNQTDGTFLEKGIPAGVDDFGMGWGTTFIDYNGDGLQDIYVANDSHFSDFDNVLYENKGNLNFEKVSLNETINSRQAGYGTAIFDYNLDGFSDLTVANNGREDYSQVFRNQSVETNWLGIKLIGTASNKDAIGATILVEDATGKIHYKTLNAGHGWASQNSSLLHFGLGEITELKKITIFWPSGLEQTVSVPSLNQYFTIVEGKNPITGISYTPISTTIESIQPSQQFTIDAFPNPNQGQFNLSIQSTTNESIHIELMDLMGKQLIAPIAQKANSKKTIVPITFPTSGINQIILLKVSNISSVHFKKILITTK